MESKWQCVHTYEWVMDYSASRKDGLKTMMEMGVLLVVSALPL